MNNYQRGYEYYKSACKKHGLEPINFHYFILKLSQEQLDMYNQYASLQQKVGINDQNI